MKGEYLKDIIRTEDIQLGKMNLIYAPCGSGKTTFVKEELPDYIFSETLTSETLYLIDTQYGKEQLLQGGKEEYNNWTDEPYWVLPGYKVMTYAGYAKLLQVAPERDYLWENGFVICDELHNAVKWSKWKDSDLHKLAIETITEKIGLDNCTAIALSATPNKIRKEFGWCLREMPLYGEPRHFENDKTIAYRNLSAVLAQLKTGQRGIIYIQQINEIKKYQEILQKRGFRTRALWSASSRYPMDKDQRDTLKEILSSRKLPKDIDILLVNSSCETSITIGGTDVPDSSIDFMIIHSSDSDVCTQLRGRYRNDLPTLYLHSKDAIDRISIPDEWKGRNLSKEEVTELIKELNVRSKNRALLKPPSFYKLLEANGHPVETKTIHGKRYHIIS